MNLKIRLAKKEDLNNLAKIYKKAYSALQINEKWTTKKAKKLLTYWIEKQPDLFFVAENENKLVGAFVSGIKPWWDGNHLFDGEIFVDPKYQKEGIGTQLLITLFTKAIKKYNANTFEASTFSNIKFPLKWYNSIGIKSNKELIFISGNLKKVLKKIK